MTSMTHLAGTGRRLAQAFFSDAEEVVWRVHGEPDSMKGAQHEAVLSEPNAHRWSSGCRGDGRQWLCVHRIGHGAGVEGWRRFRHDHGLRRLERALHAQ